jgi:hypothetical protein
MPFNPMYASGVMQHTKEKAAQLNQETSLMVLFAEYFYIYGISGWGGGVITGKYLVFFSIVCVKVW